MGYGVNGRGIGVRLPAGFSTGFVRALEPTQPSVQWVAGVFPLGVKRQGLEVDHPPPFNDEVKNGGSMTPLPNTSLWRGNSLIKLRELLLLLLLLLSSSMAQEIHAKPYGYTSNTTQRASVFITIIISHSYCVCRNCKYCTKIHPE
jgi:hypothetical protein